MEIEGGQGTRPNDILKTGYLQRGRFKFYPRDVGKEDVSRLCLALVDTNGYEKAGDELRRIAGVSANAERVISLDARDSSLTKGVAVPSVYLIEWSDEVPTLVVVGKEASVAKTRGEILEALATQIVTEHGNLSRPAWRVVLKKIFGYNDRIRDYLGGVSLENVVVDVKYVKELVNVVRREYKLPENTVEIVALGRDLIRADRTLPTEHYFAPLELYRGITKEQSRRKPKGLKTQPSNRKNEVGRGVIPSGKTNRSSGPSVVKSGSTSSGKLNIVQPPNKMVSGKRE